MAYLLLKVHLPRFASFPCNLHNYFAEITIGYFADLNSLSVFFTLYLSPYTHTHMCMYLIRFNLHLSSFLQALLFCLHYFFR